VSIAVGIIENGWFSHSRRAEPREVHIDTTSWCRPADPRNVDAENRGANIGHLGTPEARLQDTRHADHSVKEPNGNRGIQPSLIAKSVLVTDIDVVLAAYYTDDGHNNVRDQEQLAGPLA
jgi:hypothetical protein